jgi:hypothetical protein
MVNGQHVRAVVAVAVTVAVVAVTALKKSMVGLVSKSDLPRSTL